jgi:hypothetical protein
MHFACGCGEVLVMKTLTLTPPLLGFIVATRAMLAFGVGLLVAARIPANRRRQVAFTLIGVGVATTIPAARALIASVRENRGEG